MKSGSTFGGEVASIPVEIGFGASVTLVRAAWDFVFVLICFTSGNGAWRHRWAAFKCRQVSDSRSST